MVHGHILWDPVRLVLMEAAEFVKAAKLLRYEQVLICVVYAQVLARQFDHLVQVRNGFALAIDDDFTPTVVGVAFQF